ncbi:MAG: hypothetical protein IJW11_07660 [Clostridia bacterium]|nr:hypothetical protein [Clostridia bacterium]MBQ7407611.1 hypothetical protein [Clostridia bacterium]
MKDKEMGLAPLVLNEKTKRRTVKKTKQGAQNAILCKQLFPITGKNPSFMKKLGFFLSSLFFAPWRIFLSLRARFLHSVKAASLPPPWKGA